MDFIAYLKYLLPVNAVPDLQGPRILAMVPGCNDLGIYPHAEERFPG